MSHPVTATTAHNSGFAAYIPPVVPETPQDIVRNEVFLIGGITVLGGIIGLLYALWKNSNAKQQGSGTSDLQAALEGALVGFAIALISMLLYRAFHHYQAVSGMSKK